MSPSVRHTPLLTEGPIARSLLLFSLPILGANVLQSLNASVNAIWIGHYLGEAALTAVSNANLVLFFLLGVVFGISMANTILVGQAVGARDMPQAKRVVGTSTGFFVVLSMTVAILGYVFTGNILDAMGTPADAQPYAIAYLRVIFIALPPMYFYSFLMMTLRGAGDSRTPFYFMLLSVGLDIALNPLLIFGWGPVPALGIGGSALATLIAQTIALVGLVTHLYRRKHFLCLYRGELHYLKPDFTLVRALVMKGLPMGLQMVVISSSALVMISMVNAYGSQTTAAYGAASQLWTSSRCRRWRWARRCRRWRRRTSARNAGIASRASPVPAWPTTFCLPARWWRWCTCSIAARWASSCPMTAWRSASPSTSTRSWCGRSCSSGSASCCSA
ncbi:putative MATE family efflux protein [Rhodanobacter sp. TND4EL1]